MTKLYNDDINGGKLKLTPDPFTGISPAASLQNDDHKPLPHAGKLHRKYVPNFYPLFPTILLSIVEGSTTKLLLSRTVGCWLVRGG